MYVQEQQKMPLIGTFQKHFSPIRVSNDSKWHCLGDSSSVNYKEPSKLRREERYSVLISADKYGLSLFTRYFRQSIRGKQRTKIIVFKKNRDYENKTEHLLNSVFLSGVFFFFSPTLRSYDPWRQPFACPVSLPSGSSKQGETMVIPLL